MDFERLIGLADVKEKQAFAYTSIYNGKVSNDDLQKGIDEYCEQMAISFIAEHKELLSDDKIRLQLRRHMFNIGANNKHSGHRFYEALYTKIRAFENEMTQNERDL